MTKRILLTVSDELNTELEKIAKKQYRKIQDVINNVLADYVIDSKRKKSSCDKFEDAFTR